MTKGDFGALEALVHDQLLYTHSSGLTDSGASWLDALKSGRTKYKSAHISERKVRLLAIPRSSPARSDRGEVNASRAACGWSFSRLDPHAARLEIHPWQSTPQPTP